MLNRGFALFIIVCMMLSNMMVIPASADESSNVFTTTYPGFSVICTVTGRWGTSENISIKILNTGDTVIENWAYACSPGGTIDSIWNAACLKQENGTAVIINAGWNSDIPVGGSVEFGYIISDVSGRPDAFHMVSKRIECLPGEYEIKNQVHSDWGSGFSAAIEIKNNTDTPIMAWNLSYQGDIHNVSTSNFLILKEQDGQFVIKGGYNNNIAPHESVYLVYNGEGDAKSLSGFSLSKVVHETHSRKRQGETRCSR